MAKQKPYRKKICKSCEDEFVAIGRYCPICCDTIEEEKHEEKIRKEQEIYFDTTSYMALHDSRRKIEFGFLFLESTNPITPDDDPEDGIF